VDQNTVREAFWAELLGEPPEEEDEMATRSVVRTKPGSAWAEARLGTPINTEAYWAIIEGSGAARYLWSWEQVTQECFWLGLDPADTWLVDDSFLENRYHYEVEQLDGGASATATSVSTGSGIFAVILVALLWAGLELGLAADWYSLTQWQIAAVVGVVVVLAGLVAAFVSAQGAAVLRAVHRRREAPEPRYQGQHERRRDLTRV
jgi:hypothetical protein